MEATFEDDPFDPRILKKTYSEIGEELGRINIVVLGKTGIGKSTLLNTVFGESKATTGLGEPVTKKLKYHYDDNKHLGIYDTVGFELGKSTDELIGTVRNLLEKFDDNPGGKRRPHLIWFCSDGSGTRIEPTEKTFVRELSALGIPVFWILTQVKLSKGKPHARAVALTAEINKAKLNLVNSKPFLVCAEKDNDLGLNAEFGIKDLVDASFRAAPEYVMDSFAAAQIYDLEIKSESVEKAIKIATASATSIGAIPIPFSDAPGIAAAQVGMMMRIAHIYNLSVEKATLVALSATSVASATGKSIVGNLLKFIPGVGSVIGGLITGSIAGSMTYGIGKAWKDICRRVFVGELDETALQNFDFIASIFFKSYKKNSGSKYKSLENGD